MKVLIVLLISVVSCQAAFFNPWTDNGELEVTNHVPVKLCTNDITICLWTTKIAASPGGGRMIANQGGGTPQQFDFKDSGGGLKKMDFGSDNKQGGSTLWRSTAGFDNTNVLTFWAFTLTYTDTNSLKIYSNGIVMAGSWINTPTNSAGTSGSRMFIGSDNTGNRWLGYYSEVAIWNTILSKQHLELIYKSHIKGLPKMVRPDVLKAYYPLDTYPDGIQHVAGAASSGRWTRYPDRGSYGPYVAALRQDTPTHNAYGMAERICSYPPNE